MPTKYTPETITSLLQQFQKYDAYDFGDDASSIASRLKVSMDMGRTGQEMIDETHATVGVRKPEFAEKFAQAVRRLSIP